MNLQTIDSARRLALIEFLVVVIVGILLKLALDNFMWKISGPVSLVIMLTLIFFYLRTKGQGLSTIGAIKLSHAKQYWLFIPQTLITFVAIIATGLGVGLTGEALGLEFMAPDSSGAIERFGDLQGNTRLYLFWLVILWIAGPAEELYFRGFMITRLLSAFDGKKWGVAFAVFLPALVFGIGHIYYQGIRGLILTGAIGVTLGILFLLYKRNIWPLMIGHALVNTMGFTATYMGVDF